MLSRMTAVLTYFFQPFEVFEIYLTPFSIRSVIINFFFLNSHFTFLVIAGFILSFFLLSVRAPFILVSFLRYISNGLLLFAITQVRNQLGRHKMPWLSLFIFYFIFILFSNYVGLLPFSFTLTSHFNYVLIPTASIFIGITIRIFTDNLLNFLKHFVPAGIPLVIGVFFIFY